ncbi:hypothetical protein FI667_g11488, partial [Globisporangium splendens]
MEILIALIFVCQAPSMLSRFEAIFDVMDVNSTGFTTTTDLVIYDEVEVFPVLVIRPIDQQISIESTGEVISDADHSDSLAGKKTMLVASRSYLSEFEYLLSDHESNYESLYHHINSSAMQDAIALNRQDAIGRTMIHDAAEFGHGNLMELLLKTRVLLNVADRNGDTALHHAARRGHLREVSFLLREKAIAWQRNNHGKSPLFCALETAARGLFQHQSYRNSAAEPSNQHPEIKGTSETEQLSEDGVGSQHFYVTHLRYPKLHQVIDLLWDCYPPEELLAEDVYDRTCCLRMEKQIYGDLFDACRSGNLLRLQRLIDLEKRPIQQYINDQMETLGRTALHEAAELGHTATIDLLLKVGADGYDASGKAPLHLAVERKHWSVALELLGALQNRINRDPQYSATSAHVDEGLASIINAQDIQGYTALHYACMHSNEEMCLALHQAGANPMISRITYSVPHGKTNLQGTFWKRNSLFKDSRIGLDPSVSSIRKWALNHQLSNDNREMTFDVEAPLELLLMQCKLKTRNFSSCVRILETILVPKSFGQWNECTKKEGIRLVKKWHLPLFHLAADIAGVNVSVAVELCRQLSKLRLEINMMHDRTGETVLLQECKRVCEARRRLRLVDQEEDSLIQLSFVRTLLELGANVNLANETNGEAPLGCAAWYGDLPLLDLLLEAQPDTEFFVRSRSFSPLHFAALGNHLACAKMLISARSSVNIEMPQTSDETPLFFAIRSKSEDMVRLLLHSGANVGTLCTVRHGGTSFGINLELKEERKRLTSSLEKMPTFGPSQKLHGLAALPGFVVSPLTFALEVARSLARFGQLDFDLNCGNHDREYSEWVQLNQICVMIAKKIGESAATSGLITRNDIYLASALGYWDLVKLLLSHQVVLPNISSSPRMTALHYAAQAGQTAVVTSLVAAGVNVNCVIDSLERGTKHHSASKIVTRTLKRRTASAVDTLYSKIGALFFALVNGHVETAAKLIALGAKPLETLPHLVKSKPPNQHKKQDVDIHAVQLSTQAKDSQTISFYVCESMPRQFKTAYITGRYNQRHLYADAVIHFIRYLERNVNESVPILQLVAWAGHTRLSNVLIDAGMSIFQFNASPQVGRSESNGDQDDKGETAIHVAVSRGHLELLEYFAKLAQHNFPKCFLREGKKPVSLLVTTCKSQQMKALAFLLRAADVENSDVQTGGFTYAENRDEFQSALSACGPHQFAEGFQLLIDHGARPDVQTLASVLQGIGEPESPEALPTYPLHPDIKSARSPKKGRVSSLLSIARGKHPVKSRRTAAKARALLQTVVVFADDFDAFFSTGVSFDIILRIFIVCARCEFWFVFQRLFLNHATRFLDSTSIWKPAVVRAISCCLVLHRAALHNQVALIRFILALGVPADLRLSEIPSAKSPIWYAATGGCVEAFISLALALQSQSFAALVKSVESGGSNCQRSVSFRSIQESRSVSAPGSVCKWQNLSAFSCYDVPRKQTRGFLIQKLISYAHHNQRQPFKKNSLLHIACDRGDLLTVQALAENGADVAALNAMNETPPVFAAGRKDSFGNLIANYLLTAWKDKGLDEIAVLSINRALVRCYEQPPPCNLKMAKMLLDAGAHVGFFEFEEQSGCFTSAMRHALCSVQFASVKLLLDHGASLSIPLTEAFLRQFWMPDTHEARKKHWKCFAPFLAFKHQRLLEVESLMRVLLEEKHFSQAMNENLLLQLIKSAAALATTIASVRGLEKRFWSVVALAADTYPVESKAQKDEWGGRTALHYAVAGLEAEIVAKLLDIGEYDVLAEDHNRRTSLHVAATKGDSRICELLLQNLDKRFQIFGVDAADCFGRTTLHIAVIHGHEAIVGLLVNAGASTASRCERGYNALLYACKCNRLGILMALYGRNSEIAQDLLITPAGEHGLFVAARCGAFQIVRWLLSVSKDELLSQTASCGFGGMKCLQQRSLLHYAAVFGDHEFIRLHLQQMAAKDNQNPGDMESQLNARDEAGYTPLFYAFAFGRVQALLTLVEYGSNPDVSVDHSGEAKTHPYASSFNIGTLLQWFAFPGWYPYASKVFPQRDKRRVTKQESIHEDYLMNSSFRRWKTRRKIQAMTISRSRNQTSNTKKTQTKAKSGASKFEKVRTSMRSWRFPQLSLFDFVCDVGDSMMVDFVVNVKTSLFVRRSTYQSQRRNVLQAVRWNRLDVVQHLISAAASASDEQTEATNHTDGLHYLDFLEVSIDCAVSRGHGEIAIHLLTKWDGIKESGRNAADAGMFAFQFAHVLHIACIRRMTKLIEYMVSRGGEQLVAFHANDGSALVYAVAWGYTDVAALLAAHGAHFSSMDTYLAPSVKKWVEFGCRQEIQLPWYQDTVVSKITSAIDATKVGFVGPIQEHEAPEERLSMDTICHAFGDLTLGIAEPSHLHGKPSEEVPTTRTLEELQ